MLLARNKSHLVHHFPKSFQHYCQPLPVDDQFRILVLFISIITASMPCMLSCTATVYGKNTKPGEDVCPSPSGAWTPDLPFASVQLKRSTNPLCFFRSFITVQFFWDPKMAEKFLQQLICYSNVLLHTRQAIQQKIPQQLTHFAFGNGPKMSTPTFYIGLHQHP